MGIPLGSFEGVEDLYKPVLGVHDAVLTEANKNPAKDDTAAKYLDKHPEETEHPGVIEWRFDITSPGHENRKARAWTALSNEDRPRLKDMLIALGHTNEELNSGNFVLDLESEVGKPVQLELIQDNRDKTLHRVKRVMPPTVSSSSSLPD